MGNTTFGASRLNNLGGSSLIDTKGDVALNAVNTSYQTNSIEDANNYFKQGESTDVGSQLRGNIDILAAGNTSSESSFSQTKKSGLFGTSGGLGFTIGKQQTDDSNAKTALTHTDSNIGAIDGNVIIDAGRRYEQTSIHIIAVWVKTVAIAAQIQIVATSSYAPQTLTSITS